MLYDSGPGAISNSLPLLPWDGVYRQPHSRMRVDVFATWSLALLEAVLFYFPFFPNGGAISIPIYNFRFSFEHFGYILCFR